MNILMWLHVVGGSVALVSGATAATVRKGGLLHSRAGSCFCVSMFVLGLTASVLGPVASPPQSSMGGIVTCYFVATSWVAAKRQNGRTGKFEVIACVVALGSACMMFWAALTQAATTPVGRGPLFALGTICLLAGLLDLNAILRAPLTPVQRISRHLWRMSFAFFIATGSFFLGQQDVMPAAVRGSPTLFAIAFAPFVLMIFWLVRIRCSRIAMGSIHANKASVASH